MKNRLRRLVWLYAVGVVWVGWPPMLAALRRIAARKRKAKMLSFIDATKPGIEIGPSHNPVCPKSEGYKVEIIDHLNQEDLRKKYAPHGVNVNAIEPVDYVWSGESYCELTGKIYGWVIASHIIEHTPDLISFLQGCEEVLEDTGSVSLAIPDKRYCFDRLRPVSSLAAVIDAHQQRRKVHSPGTVAEYFLNVCKLNGGRWGGSTAASLNFIHTPEEALSGMGAARAGQFLDVHAWCFTPSSFRLMIEDLRRLGFTKLREVGFYETAGNEFFVTLGRHGSGPKMSRMELALKNRQETRRLFRGRFRLRLQFLDPRLCLGEIVS
jgi:hypothetical protein